jgi:hypothetical protein
VSDQLHSPIPSKELARWTLKSVSTLWVSESSLVPLGQSKQDFLAFENRAVIMPTELSLVLSVMELVTDTCQNVTKIIVSTEMSNLAMDSLLREILRKWVVRSNLTGSI